MVQYNSVICLRGPKYPIFIVEDASRYIYRMNLSQFLSEVVAYPNKVARKVCEVPHIVCLRALERDYKDMEELDFAIHTMFHAPDSLFGGQALFDVFWLLWGKANEKMPPQP